MKCFTCNTAFKEGDDVVPVQKYVTNERRGDFVTSQPSVYVHASHLKSIHQAVRMDHKQPCQFNDGVDCGRMTRMKINGTYLCHHHHHQEA